MMESKGQLKTRLAREGKWERFIEVREGLKAEGMSVKEAWDEAAGMAEFRGGVVTDHPMAGNLVDLQGVSLGSKRVDTAWSLWGLDEREFRFVLQDVEAKGTGGNLQEDINWVYSKVAEPPEVVDLRTAPSVGAIGLLRFVKFSVNGESEFYKNIWAKLIPTKNALDDLAKFFDDGRKQISIIDAVMKASEEARVAVEANSVVQESEAV